jgi:hypothetical protein
MWIRRSAKRLTQLLNNQIETLNYTDTKVVVRLICKSAYQILKGDKHKVITK